MSCFLYASSCPSTFRDTNPNPASSVNPNINPNPNHALCHGPAIERDYMGIGLCLKEGVVPASSASNSSIASKNSEENTLAYDLCGSHLKLAPPSLTADDGEDDDGEPLSSNIGWPPISSYRKATTRLLSTKPSCDNRDIVETLPLVAPQTPLVDDNDDSSAIHHDLEKRARKPLHIKISMDGTPIMRKLDLESLQGYQHLSLELHKLFKFYKRNLTCEVGVHSSFKDSNDANFILTYKDMEGDWMLVGDTPWETFAHTARRIRIMKKVK